MAEAALWKRVDSPCSFTILTSAAPACQWIGASPEDDSRIYAKVRLEEHSRH
jgi:hypothetical protein